MRIIVVDDEKLLLAELCRVLERFEGLEIIGSFSNSLAALEFVRQHANIDAAFLDVNMPKMDGLELAEQISATSPATEFVFVTAFDSYAIKAFELSAFDYVLKPVDDRRIGKTIKRLSDRVAEIAQLHGREVSGKHIQYFGAFDVFVNERAIKWPSKKAYELFAYLAHNVGKPLNKEALCEELWPDADSKRSLANLQTTVYRIRQAFAEVNCEINLTYSNDCYRLYLDKWRSDIEEISLLINDFNKNRGRIKKIYQDGYMAENGWLWSYNDAALWHQKVGDKLE